MLAYVVMNTIIIKLSIGNESIELYLRDEGHMNVQAVSCLHAKEVYPNDKMHSCITHQAIVHKSREHMEQ